MPGKKTYLERQMKAWRGSLFADLDRPVARFLAWCDMLLLDHGLIRLVYSNRHQLGPQLERSSHPSPGQIAAAAKRGVKTIVNLRGTTELGSYMLEKRACAVHGITLVDFRLKSRQLPAREKILAAHDLFQRIEYPALIHCKSGADRAGMMSVLYQIFQRNVPVRQAMQQLGLKYGHLRAAKTGVLDFLFSSFLASNETSFLAWVESSYNAKTLEKKFRPNGWATWCIDKLLQRE